MNLSVEIRAMSEKVQELYQTLQAFIPAIRNQKGCRDCRIFRDVEDEEVFLLSVHWEAGTNLEDYMRTNSGGALLGAIGLLSESAKVKTGRDAQWEGVDILKRMRGK